MTCSTLFLYISLPLFCTTTTWNFQKLPGYTFYGENVARVLAFLIFSPPLQNFMIFLQEKKCPLFFLSRSSSFSRWASLACRLTWPVSFSSSFSFSIFQMCGHDNYSKLNTLDNRIQKYFPLSVFVFIDSLVVSASQDAGGHTLSGQNNLTFGIGLHEVGVLTVGVCALRHNQIFLLS